MTRREQFILLRLVALVVGLVGGGLFLVAPLWTKAGEVAAQRRSLLADESRVEADWNTFAAELAARGMTGTLDRSTLSDSTLAQLLTRRPLPPPGGMHRAADAMPLFLAELGRIGDEFGIDWSGAKNLGTELTTAPLASGEALPVTHVTLEISGRGPFVALGRALRALGESDVPVRIRGLKLESASDDEVAATLTLDLYGAP
jgi:hypothetical protein